MRKILLIGGAGYIGSALREHFINKGYIVNIQDLGWFGTPGLSENQYSNLDFKHISTRLLLENDAIVFSAAHASVPMCELDKTGAIVNNVYNFINLMNKMVRANTIGLKFIYMSSSCVYTGLTEATEEDTINPPQDILTLSKSTIDEYIMNLKYHSPCIYGLRLGSVNGMSPNFRTDLVINSMVRSAQKERKIKIFHPESRRSIVSTKDICRLVETIIEKGGGPKRSLYNVSSFNTKVSDIAEYIAKITDSSIVDIEPTTKGYDFNMNNQKVCKDFNFEFKSTLASLVDEIYKSDLSRPEYRDRNKNIKYLENYPVYGR